MNRLLPVFLLLTGLTFGCDNAIKDSSAEVEVEDGAAVPASPTDTAPAAAPQGADRDAVLGFWVGEFRPDVITEEVEAHTWSWDRTNKINIALDRIVGDSVYGHSVVAGNDRPFAGTRAQENGVYQYSVREPGDDKYDGEFNFTIADGRLAGVWEAFKNIEINKRAYELTAQDFTYNPGVELQRVKEYVDWNESREQAVSLNGETEEWLSEHFASATDKIYSMNASAERLEKAEVENLKKGDLTIIRNTIYARHGYSFKNRPLRVFFDAQPWYIPVHADIRADFTELEKDNIQLLLKYEENAAEYYDFFGRG